MRKSTKSAVAITIAIAGVIASPFSSNASAFELKEDSRSFCNPARNELKGRVAKVSDGDTITILDAGNNQHKIRLNGIDAPEKSQAFGQKSRVHLSSLVSGNNVTVVYKSKDRYGRVLGTVITLA